MKKICIFTCNRAEYYKLELLIKYFNKSNNFELYLVVCGSHLIYDFGMTVDLIKYPIYKKVNTLIYGSNNKTMAESCALGMSKFPQLLEEINPDAVIIHGDRFDVISVAISCSLMNICLIHIEGGELTGTIDEHLRHAITKLSTYHFVANEDAKQNLLQLGEIKDNVFVIGCPSYDKISNIDRKTSYLKNIGSYNFSVNKNDYIIAIYHPVTTNIEKCVNDFEDYIDILIEIDKKVVFFYPNVDNGSKRLIKVINQKKIRNNNNFVVLKSLPMDNYITLLSYSACIVGNSSSGIREACIFGTPSISIGTRQNNRIRTQNTIVLDNFDKNVFKSKLNEIYGKSFPKINLYGKNNTIKLIDNIMNRIELKYKEKNFNKLL